jgi:hypothetical protein
MIGISQRRIFVMFEENRDFYPTPEPLVEKMLEGVNFDTVSSVLEPSAGKGDLVEGFTTIFQRKTYSRWGGRDLDTDCIELQPELQMILKGKGYRVVHNDFLTYHTYKKYDLIISNPPFSQGAKHLLKMLDMQESGGGVICLLNAETLKNPYTAERKVLLQRLTALQADIQYIEGAFLGAERKTGVEVAIVKVFIPQKEASSFIFEETLRKAEDLEYKERAEQDQDTALAENDLIKAVVKQYNIEVEAGIKLIDEFYAIKPKILRSFDESDKCLGSILCLTLNNGANNIYANAVTYNGFVKMVREKYWKALFNNPMFTGALTKKLLRDYRGRVAELANYDFSEYNILTLKEEMSKQVVKGVEEAIISLFDELSCKHHWYDETSNNIHYFNGWKTNKSWIINKKVIIPLSGYKDLGYSWGGYNPSHRDVLDKLADIEKGFNYLDGGLTDSVDMEAILKKAKEDGQTKKIPLKYFTVTFYKKGTCHIEFTNDDLLKKFNIFGSQRKGWLPPSYGKKSYAEMGAEEQAVVNEFEGEQEYNKVVKNKGYYICKTENLLMLGSGEEL